MRVAAIDIGTNSVLLTVVERDPAGNECTLLDRATVTRLGQGVDRTGRLAQAAIERTLECLSSYARTLCDVGVDKLAVVGTSALRDAANAELFTYPATALLGTTPQVIAGELEAKLTFRGALSRLALEGPILVLDVGGGSTEIITGFAASDGAHAETYRSLDIGCVRLSERYIDSDPPTASALAAISENTRAAVAAVESTATARQVVAVAGTATTLAAMQLELEKYDGSKVHGRVISLGDLDALTARLASTTQAERCHLRGLDPQRADVIVTGGVMLTTLLRVFAQDQVTISDRGVRYGLIDELFRNERSF